ncbi:MAG TPA: hypothetical protein VJ844_08580, partial [Mucilaginibacter sp.]|nr:hypothetical protein [Mucilaginibacter sp.]
MSISAKKLVFYFIAGLTAFLSRDGDAQSAPKRLQADTIRLSGNWFFQTDPKDIGVNERWYDKKLTGQIKLPGSMTSNHLGNDISVHTPWTGGIEDSSWFHKPEYAAYRKQGNIKIPFWLQPEKYYKGVAWYQKTIVVPAGWRGKSAELFIERAHWTSAVYLDNTRLGSRNSLGSPHRYYLEALTPGKHILSVSIDNRINEINVGINSHSISDHTQGNWNGMVGRMYLAVKPRVYIEDIQLFPDIDHGLVNARVAIRKTSKTHESVTLHFRAALQQGGPALPAIVRKVSLTRNMDTINILYKMGVRPQLWSEHHPSLYRMQVDLISDKDRDSHSVLFGMRKFSEKGTQFTINGHPVML